MDKCNMLMSVKHLMCYETICDFYWLQVLLLLLLFIVYIHNWRKCQIPVRDEWKFGQVHWLLEFPPQTLSWSMDSRLYSLHFTEMSGHFIYSYLFIYNLISNSRLYLFLSTSVVRLSSLWVPVYSTIQHRGYLLEPHMDLKVVIKDPQNLIDRAS